MWATAREGFVFLHEPFILSSSHRWKDRDRISFRKRGIKISITAVDEDQIHVLFLEGNLPDDLVDVNTLWKIHDLFLKTPFPQCGKKLNGNFHTDIIRPIKYVPSSVNQHCQFHFI